MGDNREATNETAGGVASMRWSHLQASSFAAPAAVPCNWFAHRTRGLLRALVLLTWIAASAGQEPEASLQGTVRDSKGQPVAGAAVTATHSETGLTQRTTTQARGEYFFGSLPRGLYNLKVEITGYRGLEKQAIELVVGGRREENFTLTSLSASREETEVAQLFQIIPPAPTLQVDTVSSSVSVLVGESQILDLPLESRNIYALFLLQPGVTSQGAALRGLSFSVHGQRVLGSNYMLDGVDNNNTLLSGPVAATSAEAVQEFR